MQLYFFSLALIVMLAVDLYINFGSKDQQGRLLLSWFIWTIKLIRISVRSVTFHYYLLPCEYHIQQGSNTFAWSVYMKLNLIDGENRIQLIFWLRHQMRKLLTVSVIFYLTNVKVMKNWKMYDYFKMMVKSSFLTNFWNGSVYEYYCAACDYINI